MTHELQRRLPQFTLRTMFVIVTVMACWLAFHLNWIRERNEFLVKHERLCALRGLSALPSPTKQHLAKGLRPPLALRMLGESTRPGVCLVVVVESYWTLGNESIYDFAEWKRGAAFPRS